MRILRLQVEGGFLDSLDVTLSPGLNVLIGPRGSGKTSVIELLRYCLEVPGYTPESDREATKHALSVLRDGRVTVTVEIDGTSIILSRSADEDHARRSAPVAIPKPTVLSQKEIELVGRDARGRLRLIDEFRTRSEQLDSDEVALRSSIASLTEEIRALTFEIEELTQQLIETNQLDSQIEEAAARHVAIQETLGAAQPDQQQLDEVAAHVAALGVQLGVLERATHTLRSWRQRIEGASLSGPEFEVWPIGETPHAYEEARARVEAATVSIQRASSLLAEAIELIAGLVEDETRIRLEFQDQARSLRRKLDQIQMGFGDVSRLLADLREKKGQREALQRLLESKRGRANEVRDRRRAALDGLDELRIRRHTERQDVTTRLNTLISPDVSIQLIRDGLQAEYAGAIAATLRGSGLQYNILAPLLAARISPRELAEAIEASDFSTIAELGEITEERANRAVAHARQVGTSAVLTAALEDEVCIYVTDGTEEKSTDDVSTGQRCTAILPILLAHEDRVLIIDQPEDHLDNAFIVTRVVSSLMQASESTQIVLSSHNANIPVLGGARRVIMLGSDGKRGYEVVNGPLDDSDVVDAITSVMEGGREAFARRAAFYSATAHRH